jgi:hypothetical protein
MGADSQKRQRSRAKKLERLRRRQAERRRAHDLGAEALGRVLPLGLPAPSSASPSRAKLSEILIELARPYVHPEERTLEEMRAAIAFTATVWNAVVLEQTTGDGWTMLEEEIRERMGEEAPETLGAAEDVRRRKLARFASDLRVVGHWEVTERGDHFNVNVIHVDTLPALPAAEEPPNEVAPGTEVPSQERRARNP